MLQDSDSEGEQDDEDEDEGSWDLNDDSSESCSPPKAETGTIQQIQNVVNLGRVCHMCRSNGSNPICKFDSSADPLVETSGEINCDLSLQVTPNTLLLEVIYSHYSCF